MVDLGTSDNSGFALSVAESLYCQVGRIETGTAGSVDRDAGSAKVEMVRDPVGNHGWHVSERASDLRVILQMRISILEAT